MPIFFVFARDCNACFSHIFKEKTFGMLTPDEMNILSSLRTLESFRETCQKDVVTVLNSSTLVSFMNCELNYNSWSQFVSAILQVWEFSRVNEEWNFAQLSKVIYRTQQIFTQKFKFNFRYKPIIILKFA